jgi:SAM-dependent methyltransferase
MVLPSVGVLKNRFYGGVPGWKSGTVQYMELVDSCMKPAARVLDIGAGEGRGFSHPLKGRVGELVGLDPAPGVVSNPALDRGVVGTAERMPFRDASFDACVCSFVLEHVSGPARMAREVARVLKPGGVLVLRTPNLWHYTSMTARATPQWFHRLVANRARGLAGAEAGPNPTHYRCNSPGRIRRVFGEAGLSVEELRMVEPEPSYLQFSRCAFLLGVAYERMVNSCGRLAPFRVTILAVLRTPNGESHGSD